MTRLPITATAPRPARSFILAACTAVTFTMFPQLLRATLELGFPVAALSWLLFYRLYSRGELARDADRKSLRSSLKEIRKTEKASKQPADSLLHAKWMKFGGGFYGVAALWTLFVIEASGAFGVIAHPSNLEEMFRNGLVSFVANWVTGQITTFVDSAIWFTWWPGSGHGPVVWIAVAYVAYIVGLNLARYETGFGGRIADLDSRSRWRSLMPFRKDGSNDQGD